MAEAEGDIVEIDLTQLRKMKVSGLMQYLVYIMLRKLILVCGCDVHVGAGTEEASG